MKRHFSSGPPHGCSQSDQPAIEEGVALLDLQLCFLEVNEQIAVFSGRPPREHIGRPLHELLPTLAPALGPLLGRVLRSGTALRDFELRAELHGQSRHWLVSAEPLRDREGAVLAVECCMRELAAEQPVPALTPAQVALQVATEQLAFQASILEQLNDAVMAVDNLGAISYWGAGAERLFGAPAMDVAGRPVAEVMRLDELPPGTVADAQALLVRGEMWRGEVVLRTSAGATVRVDVSARALLGATVNYLVVLRDISERHRAEQAARESQQLFRMIADASPDLIYIYDKIADKNVYANRELFTMLGYSVEDVQALGSSFIPTTIHPDDLAGVMAFGARLEASGQGEVLEHEYRIRHADGSYRWLYAREVLLSRDPAGRSHLLLGVAQDVTARKEADLERAALHAREQEALRRSDEMRALLDTLIGSAPIGFDFVDRDLRFVLVNEALAANNGLPASAHLGRTVREVLPALADNVEPLLRQVLETGEPILDMEVRGETPAQVGVQRIWRESLYPVRDRRGELLGVGAIITEITEHRRASEERAQLLAAAKAAAERTASLQAITAALAPALTSAEVARVIVEAAVGALHARSGVVLLLDRSGEQLEVAYAVGYSSEILTGRRWLLSASEPLADAVRGRAPIFVRDLDEARALYPAMDEARALTSDVAWANLPLINESRVQGALSLGFAEPQRFEPEDQALLAAMAQQCAQALERARLYEAERLAREEAERAVRERDELVALISHDLKNPLTVIQGQAQLLERRLSRGDEVERARLIRGLTAIHQAAGHMSTQIEELLDIAMIRAGRPLRLDLQHTDLVAIVQRAMAMVQGNTEQHSLRLSVEQGQFAGEWDGPRVERVVSNLLSNAVKYSPSGGEVHVLLRNEQDAGGNWATISVADSGIGIPASDLPHIFERFHRAANTAGRIKGTGLGLTSALRIVEQQGGTITVTSVEGVGSTFVVRLPL